MKIDSSIRLLIVDASLDDAENANQALRKLGVGIRITRVSSLAEVGEALADSEFDLMLCSLETLAIDELVGELRARQCDTPVIALTSPDNPVDICNILQQGARDLVRKHAWSHLEVVVARELEYLQLKRSVDLLVTSYADSEKRCRALMESSRDAIAYVHEGMHVYANIAYLELFGFERFDDIEGTPLMDMVDPELQQPLKSILRSTTNGASQEPQLRTRLRHATGHMFEGDVYLCAATIDGEHCTQIVIRDSKSDRELEQQIDSLSRSDPLTGLFNRQHLVNSLAAAVNAVEEDRQNYVLFNIAADGFEKAKQTLGVVHSDEVVNSIAQTLKPLVQKGDILCRFEGATFSLIGQRADNDAIELFSGTVLQKLDRNICEVDGKSINTPVSIGVSKIDDQGLDVNDVLTRAERALEDAQSNGGNAFKIYEPSDGELSQQQIDNRVNNKIISAMQANSLRVLYQPIVSIAGDANQRYEVTIALPKAEQAISHKQFLAAASRPHIAAQLNRWMILNVLKQLAIRLRKRASTMFFVQLLDGALEDPQLFSWISERITSLKMAAGTLVLQIDEHAALAHLKQARAFALALHKINCKLALSNFGDGPNPFQLLKHVPADYLKLREDFAVDLPNTEVNQQTLRNICEKSKAQGKQTVVSGVCDAASVSILWTLGADMIQGSFLQGASEDLAYDFDAMSA